MNTNGTDATIRALRVALGQASRRTQVVASNLANIDTPGYRAMAVSFPDALGASLQLEPGATHSGHLIGSSDSELSGTLVDAPAALTRFDGNTVDVDREMTLLAMSKGQFRTAAEMMRKRFALLLYAATDGRHGS